jgi:hypothetical protein
MNYAQALEEFSILAISSAPDDQFHAVNFIRLYFLRLDSDSDSRIEWDELSGRDYSRFLEQWYNLRQMFGRRHIELTEMIMSSCTPIRAFRFPWETCR